MSLSISIASTPNELEQVYAIRMEVFVDEQKVPLHLEMDEDDQRAIHVLASLEQEAVGCGRILLDNDHAHIGRVAVLKKHRCKGIGKQLMLFLISICKEKGAKEIVLHAQLQAMKFYENLGFQAYGDIFLDADIEHRAMKILCQDSV